MALKVSVLKRSSRVKMWSHRRGTVGQKTLFSVPSGVGVNHGIARLRKYEVWERTASGLDVEYGKRTEQGMRMIG